MKKEIEAGDWISSESYGDSVCIGVENEWIKLRYAAARPNETKIIWVENAEHKDYVKFLKPMDSVAKHVLTLKGPYGEEQSEVKPKPKF